MTSNNVNSLTSGWLLPTFMPSNSSFDDEDLPTNATSNNDFITTSIIWGFIGAITVMLNFVVLAIIIARKRLHNTTNVILGSMFFSDILFAAVYIFPRWVNPFYYRDWLYCSLVAVFAPLASAIINMHLMAASIDKFIATQFAIRYKVSARPLHAYLAVACIWILTLLMAFMPLIAYRPIYQGLCYPWHNAQQYKETIFNMIFLALFFILPLLVMIGCYTRIYFIASKSLYFNSPINNDARSMRKHYKLARVLGILVLTYFIMWTPFTSIYIISLFYSPFEIATSLQGYREALAVAQYIAFTYPAINPLLYGYFIPEIRNPVMRVLCRSSRVSPLSCTPIVNNARVKISS
ncbi:C-C chemokine receptor type 1 [Trichoplax sp. H2]|uniref:G-protein coupled receptors family 1 profile domain-containing protein n=1 Tax=Trichoplax adhaerens TaxID=10228 RepID=B3RL50_TRIAD|nr:hypothetical protein TRIADDRAFT_51878 [Trichoplax adhaerens]EDV28701.1 hypothetical protein TRIADDRAFT_51878 [Trichoplax adhaerens]RDD45001.1 C-C chemokine receptor type 1 [Trichoplax sp. H2]|eukprot:XP_002107903.1 hypothetical protein TRIADDRAFT_51878 [Trichoplax adhaerens]